MRGLEAAASSANRDLIIGPRRVVEHAVGVDLLTLQDVYAYGRRAYDASSDWRDQESSGGAGEHTK